MIELVDIETGVDLVDFVPGASVERDRNGRPKIYSNCMFCIGSGKMPSPKTGNLIQCKACKGDGFKGKFYSRTTSYIDNLDDKKALQDWKLRTLLEGVRRKPELLATFAAVEDFNGTGKAQADALVEELLDAADAGLKADLGSALHRITEDIDAGQDPGFIPDEFLGDIEAYRIASTDFEHVLIEVFAVLDEFGIAGTFDRLIRVWGELARRLGLEPGTLVVGDIKTGGIDFARGKIGMQLAAYSRMQSYDKTTFERGPLTSLGEVNQKVGLIIHMPSGQGVCEVVTVDLEKGWEALQLARKVREYRNFWNTKAGKGEIVATSVSQVVQS